MEFITLKENYTVVFVWNNETSFIRIYFSKAEKNNEYREIGTVLTYFDKGDAELLNPHWHGECYLSEKHFEDSLIDALLNFLLKNTKCKSPLLLNINKGERFYGKYRQVGNLTQSDE